MLCRCPPHVCFMQAPNDSERHGQNHGKEKNSRHWISLLALEKVFSRWEIKNDRTTTWRSQNILMNQSKLLLVRGKHSKNLSAKFVALSFRAKTPTDQSVQKLRKEKLASTAKKRNRHEFQISEIWTIFHSLKIFETTQISKNTQYVNFVWRISKNNELVLLKES